MTVWGNLMAQAPEGIFTQGLRGSPKASKVIHPPNPFSTMGYVVYPCWGSTMAPIIPNGKIQLFRGVTMHVTTTMTTQPCITKAVGDADPCLHGREI